MGQPASMALPERIFAQIFSHSGISNAFKRLIRHNRVF
jgi:hypothetical protein